MSGTLLFPLLAVHISDGILRPSWIGGGLAVAAALALYGARHIRDEEIPKIAVLTAAFFVASYIHVSVGASSVHLLLNGLIGIVLGRRAALAIPVGLFLQAALLGHGGFYSLGVNSCVMTLPAFLTWGLFVLLQRTPWLKRSWFRAGLVFVSAFTWLLCLVYGATLLFSPSETSGRWARIVTLHPLTLGAIVCLALIACWVEHRLENAPEFPLGLLLGQVAVLVTILLNCLTLAYGAEQPEDLQKLALGLFIAHLPIALVEGVVLGFTMGFLVRVKPEMLHWTPKEEAECSVDAVP
jgi:cobalt/nickel transport system permease protein